MAGTAGEDRIPANKSRLFRALFDRLQKLGRREIAPGEKSLKGV